jgi:hypothetical protein
MRKAMIVVLAIPLAACNARGLRSTDTDTYTVDWQDAAAQSAFDGPAPADANSDGNAPSRTFAPLSHASSVASDGMSLYWVAGNNQILRQSVAGGTATVIASDACSATESIALDDGFVYWSHGYTSASCPAAVMRTPKEGGATTTLATGLIFPGNGGLVLDDKSVYMVAVASVPPNSAGSGRASVYSVPKTGGTATAIAGTAGAIGAPAVDGKNVYWIASDSPLIGSAISTSVMRTSIGDSSSVTLATVPRNVTTLFFFGDRIYWAASGYHGVEYLCIDCDSPATVQSLGNRESTPVSEVTLATGAFVIDAVADAADLWLSIEGTRSGQGVDYPPNDDYTGTLQRAPKDGTSSVALGGLPFTNRLAIDDQRVFAFGGDGAPVSVAR